MLRFSSVSLYWLPIGLTVPLALGSVTTAAHAQTATPKPAAATPAQPASAQPSPPPPPPPPADANAPGDNVQNIVVSAPTASQATVQQQQSQPAAATVVTSQQLQSNQVTNIQEAKRLEPSVQIKIINVRNIAINIRGLGQASASALDGIEDGVPVYVDGVYQARPGQALFDIPSLDNIVVAKGPQGTRGGQDSTGGAISVNTKPPEFTNQQYGEVSAGNYGYYDVQLGATGPILGSDKAAFRLDAYASDRSGYVSNPYTGQDYNDWRSAGFRGQLLLTPSDNLTIRIIGGYDHVDSASGVYGLTSVQTHYSDGAPILNGWFTRLGLASTTAGRAYLFIPPAATPYSVALDTMTRVKQEDGNLSMKVSYDVNGYTLSSITAGGFWNFYPANDGDYTNLPVLLDTTGTIYQRQATQEFRVTSPHGNRVEFSAGVFSLWEQVLDDGRQVFGQGAGGFYNPTTTNLALATQALNNLHVASVAEPITSEIAPYANATFHATPNLDMIGGLRYTYEWKSGSFYQDEFGTSFAGLTPAQIVAAQKLQITRGNEPTATFDSGSQHIQNGLLTGLATLAYHITPETQLYATYSTGAKSGGVNLSSGLPAGAPYTVKPEHVDNYEVGVKNEFFSHRLVINGTAFWMADHDYQSTAASPVNATPYLSNAKEVISRGLELDIRAQPVTSLTTYASASFDEAFYESYNNAPPPPYVDPASGKTYNLTGATVALVPRWSAALGAEYRNPVGTFGTQEFIGYFGGDFSWQSNFYSLPDGSPLTVVPSYGILNLHVGITPASGRWDLSFWIHNALDVHYITQNQILVTNATGAYGAQVGDPLMFGVTLRAKI